jgi:hypothetical protein
LHLCGTALGPLLPRRLREPWVGGSSPSAATKKASEEPLIASLAGPLARESLSCRLWALSLGRRGVQLAGDGLPTVRRVLPPASAASP